MKVQSPAFTYSISREPEYDSVAAFWIFPFDVLVRAADPAAAAFMAAFIAYLHPFSFPFINLSRAEYGAKFIRALCHADVMVKYGKMRFRVTLKP